MASISISSAAIFSRQCGLADSGSPSSSCVCASSLRWRKALRRRGPKRLAAALELEQVLGVGPALVLLADPVLDRHLHVGEEDLVDLVAHRRARAVDQVDRIDLDAGRLHVDQQEGDALLPLALVRGPHQAEDPVGPMGVGRPDLLAVDDVVVALHARPWCAGCARSEPEPGSE